MPMELLFSLAQRELPTTVDDPCDIDKLRVIAAAQLVQARLPDVGADEQKAEVFAITQEGRAALAKAYPHHTFKFTAAGPVPPADTASWHPSLGAYKMERGTAKTRLDS